MAEPIFTVRRSRLLPTGAVLLSTCGGILIFLTLACGGTLRSQAAIGFQVGAARSVITPPLGVSINGHFTDRKARHIHDELHARCVVLDDGEARLAIVLCDSCMIPREIIEKAKNDILHRTGLRPDHVLISATHTHTAPTCAPVFQSDPDPDYPAFLSVRIADGVVRAVNNLHPARGAWGKGAQPDHVFNRRWFMRPGSIPPNPFGGTNDQVRMNPPVGSADLMKPAGPTDPEVAVVSFVAENGRPIALLANYSLHYVGTSRNEDVSADYFGIFATQLERLMDAKAQDPFVALLSNGTSGDVNNINFRKARPVAGAYEQAGAVAEAIVAETHGVFSRLDHTDHITLDARQTEIHLGVRRPSRSEIVRAERILNEAGPGPLKTAEEVYARETVLMKDYPAEVPLVIQVLRIGELAVAAIPCEVFAETGLWIKQNSPFKQTFTVSLANGYNGYLPTPEQHRLGGYETWRARSSYLETQAEPKIREAVLQLLLELHRNLKPVAR